MSRQVAAASDPWAPLPGFEPYAGPKDDGFTPLGSNGLKEFVTGQAAEKTQASTVHVAGQPFKIFFDDVWRADGTLNGQRHRVTANDRQQLIDKLMNLAKREAIHELSRAEQLLVIRLCQNGRKYDAIDVYLKAALGKSQYATDPDAIARPELLPLMNEIAEFIWFHSTPQAEDSEEWHAFKEDFLNGRPFTFDLLQAAFEAFQDAQKHNRVGLLTSQLEEPKAPDSRVVAASLDEMTDAQIDSQYKTVARAFARR
jgi:hypothetical protein